MSPIKPINGHIVIRPKNASESKVGNILISDLGHEKPELGEVIAVSSTYNYNTGENITPEINVGDTVIIPKLGAIKVPIGNDDYYITKSTEILGIIKEEQ